MNESSFSLEQPLSQPPSWNIELNKDAFPPDQHQLPCGAAVRPL